MLILKTNKYVIGYNVHITMLLKAENSENCYLRPGYGDDHVFQLGISQRLAAIKSILDRCNIYSANGLML